MTHKNLKIEKKKEYNPFVVRTIKRKTVGKVKCYIKAVKPNPKDVFGIRKLAGARYTQAGHVSVQSNIERYDPETVYYYEIGASDRSYRKCTTREDAERRFAQLVEFEKRQTEIR